MEKTIEFADLDLYEGLGEFASALGGSLAGGLLRFDNDLGHGQIQQINLENGLVLRAWDFTFEERVQLKRKVEETNQRSRFGLLYILTPETLHIKSSDIQKPVRVHGLRNTVFCSEDASVSLTIEARRNIKVLELSFHIDWLTEHLSTFDPKVLRLTEQLVKKKLPTVLLESCAPGEYLTLSDLHNVIMGEAPGLLYVRSKVYLLLGEFFGKVITRDEKELLDGHLHFNEVINAETILLQYLRSPLPRISAIARKVALSESTLKRSFKMMYGKNIYEYYLEKKMDLGKHLIMNEHYNVNEVAMMLGYDKVSNFISMFKKHHGVSPGTVKRSSAH